MEFRLLGPLEVEDDGRTIPLGGAKQRALFALLLLHRNRAVATDRLIEAVWSGNPPETAAKSVQVYVSGLRKALGDGRIVTRERGYELRVEPGETDVDRFDAFVRHAASAPPAEASRLLHEALGLVRGRPLDDISLEPWAAPEVARLEERILAATEARVDADLAIGRQRDLVAELEELVETHPFHERFLEQLMLALYRTGRQADALDAYRRGASRLRDELGLEPGRSLRDLEAAVLRHDPVLDAPESSSAGSAARRRRRGWKLVVAGAVGLLVAGAAAFAVAVSRGSSASLESLPPGVAIIEADTGSLVSHISTDEIPDPVEVVSGSGSFWVWNLSPFSLVEISPDTGEILQRIGSPFAGDATEDASWFLPDRSSVWFTGPRELVRVDTHQGRAVDRFTLVEARHRLGLAWVARCAGSLWVASNEENTVLRVNPSNGAVQARIKTQYPWAVACGDGGLWVTSNYLGLRRIDPRSNTIVATAPIETELSNVAVGGGFAWTTSETRGTLYKIDPSGRIVGSYQTGDGARQLAFGGGRVWVANQDVGTVTGIDAATGGERTYRFSHPVQSVGVLGDRLLVELLDGLTFEERIDELRGDVAKLIVPIYVFDPPDPATAFNPWIFALERATCGTLMTRASDSAPLEPQLAASAPRLSADHRTFEFTLRSGVRFGPQIRRRDQLYAGAPRAPAESPLVTAGAVRFSIERALSPKLGSDTPGIRFLGDLVGARAFHAGTARHIEGIRVRANTIAFTLTKPSADFLERLSLPFFCTVPIGTALVQGGVQPVAPASTGPYYMTDRFNGEYLILQRNPNYAGPRPALDAIAFREGLSPETAVRRVESGEWDGVIHYDELFAPGGLVARRAKASDRLRYEVLPVRGIAFEGVEGSLYALLSTRLGCDPEPGVLDLATLCIAGD